MRLGILTLHDSVNYGALLQAYALAAHLRGLGHEAVVIDRRRKDAKTALRTPPVPAASIKWLGLVEIDAHTGSDACRMRIARSLEFLKRQVGVSSYAFSDWQTAPADLGVDAVVVGSDQVWNANNLDPADYLMIRMRQALPGVAYAASLGMPRIPDDCRETYRAGLARFAAVGVREREAADLLADMGVRATQVVDPVLLAGRNIWEFPLQASAEEPRNKVFAYFLAEDFPSLFKPLCRFAAMQGSRVSFFTDWFCLGEPRGLRGVLRNARRLKKWRSMGIDLRLDAGPVEFVRSLWQAETVVTNSYHGLMFAILFGKQVRVVLPTHPVRRAMNSRLLEVAETFLEGPVVHESLSAAVRSLAGGEKVRVRNERLAESVLFSRQWLVRALDGISKRGA